MSLQSDVSVFLRVVADSADLPEGLLAAQGPPKALEAPGVAEVSLADVSHVELSLTLASIHRVLPPSQPPPVIIFIIIIIINIIIINIFIIINIIIVITCPDSGCRTPASPRC